MSELSDWSKNSQIYCLGHSDSQNAKSTPTSLKGFPRNASTDTLLNPCRAR